MAADCFPLHNEPAKSQFLRPRAHGRIWFSHQLLSMGTAPLSTVTRQRRPAFHRRRFAELAGGIGPDI